MILDDQDANDLPDIPAIAALDLTGRSFHLTGSRFIGGAKPDSDWDFVTQPDELTESYLMAAGFAESPKFNKAPGKNDGFTSAIYESTYRGVKVQVQVATDLQRKLKARDAIRLYPHIYWSHFFGDTAKRISIWSALCEEKDVVLTWPQDLKWMGVDLAKPKQKDYSVF